MMRLPLPLALTVELPLPPARATADRVSGTGTLEGRVLNLTSKSYLTNARITVDGTTLEAFTDDSGEFRLPGVPACPLARPSASIRSGRAAAPGK